MPWLNDPWFENSFNKLMTHCTSNPFYGSQWKAYAAKSHKQQSGAKYRLRPHAINQPLTSSSYAVTRSLISSSSTFFPVCGNQPYPLCAFVFDFTHINLSTNVQYGFYCTDKSPISTIETKLRTVIKLYKRGVFVTNIYGIGALFYLSIQLFYRQRDVHIVVLF